MESYGNLIDSALGKLSIDKLNEMQQAALRVMENDSNDMVLLSPTGSGKTLAYLLPLLRLMDASNDEVQALVLVPSRELALQIITVFTNMNTPFRAFACYGGRPAMDEHRSIRGIRPQLIAGTPGRVLDHITKENINPHTIRILVIDEFDKSLELGFQEEMHDIIQQLTGLERRILLSATDAEEIPQFTGLNHTERLNFLNEQKAEDRININIVHSPVKDKLDTLYNLLCTFGSDSTLVFVNYRETVERISQYLKEKKVDHGAFHGGLEQEDRERALYKFRNGSCSILVSTDLASRGLDIPEIKNIVHYHLPVNEEAYIHRNGRTARWNTSGNSYMILNDTETVPEYIKQPVTDFVFPDVIPASSKSALTTLYIGKGKKDKLNKIDIVGFLCKKGGLTSKEIGLIDVKGNYSFAAIKRSKLNSVLNNIKGEKIKNMKTIIEEAK